MISTENIDLEAVVQKELPFAVIQGEPLSEPPEDLYIPPDALEVFLEAFEGPLDLLLYLINRQKLDILDLPVADITQQYMDYIELMNELKFELAAEYLVMAAMLAEIKSRMLLPRPVESGEEDDPRAELIKRLQEYECFRKAAENLESLPQVGRETHLTLVEPPKNKTPKAEPEVSLQDIMMAFKNVLQRADMYSHHHVALEPLSVRERMSGILDQINADNFTEFNQLFKAEEGRRGAVVSLLALLELIKEAMIEMIQAEPFAPIYVKIPGSTDEPKSA